MNRIVSSRFWSVRYALKFMGWERATPVALMLLLPKKIGTGVPRSQL
jgi:hypothetical protein